MIAGGVAATPKERRQTRSALRGGLCVQTRHVSGPCLSCARSVADLAHVAEGGAEGIRIHCGQCCPCSAAERQQTGPDSGRRMNA